MRWSRAGRGAVGGPARRRARCAHAGAPGCTCAARGRMTTASQTLVQQLVTFRLGDDQFAVDILEVERVLRFTAPAAVPNLPAWIDGVIEHGGRVVPVIDLRSRFGLPRLSPLPEHRILVLAVGAELLGVTVDSVHEV